MIKLKFSWFNKEFRHYLINIILMVLLAFIVNGVLIFVATGENPLEAYGYLIIAFSSVRGLTETLVRATPLLLTGLGLGVAFKARYFNIGAEGQLLIGAAAATWVGITFSQIPGFVLFPLFFLGGFLGGGLWGAIPGIIKVKFNVSEIISTLMMNYIAILFLEYLIGPLGPLGDPLTPFPMSPEIPSSIFLPILVPKTRLHGGILIAFLMAVLLYFLLSKTTIGYKIRAIGASPKAAAYGGISISKNMLISMLISGGLAGLAGAIEISGLNHRLITAGIYRQYGFTAIPVALLGGLHPIGIIFSAFFFAGLAVGVDMMARNLGINIYLSIIMQALVIIFVMSGAPLRRIYRQWFRREKVE